MNWMTTAKSRVQSTNKKRKYDTLRMNAITKVIPSNANKVNQVTNSNFNSKNDACLINQSKDVLMLNNFNRKRKENTIINNNPTIQLASYIVPGNNKINDSDPLNDLQISPVRKSSSVIPDYEELQEQQVLFFNDGELCDQLGNLLIERKQLSLQCTSTIPYPNEHPDPERSSQYIATTTSRATIVNSSLLIDEWWHKVRLIKLLDSGSIENKMLYHICQELSVRKITPPPPAPAPLQQQQITYRASTALSKSTPPTTQEELVYKQQHIVPVQQVDYSDSVACNNRHSEQMKQQQQYNVKTPACTSTALAINTYEDEDTSTAITNFSASSNNKSTAHGIYQQHHHDESDLLMPSFDSCISSKCIDSHCNNCNYATRVSNSIPCSDKSQYAPAASICEDWNLFARNTTSAIDDLHLNYSTDDVTMQQQDDSEQIRMSICNYSHSHIGPDAITTNIKYDDGTNNDYSTTVKKQQMLCDFEWNDLNIEDLL